MRSIVGLIAVFLLGCSGAPPSMPYPSGQRITVTAAYDTHAHVPGDEFLFSVVLPPEEVWIYTPAFKTNREGRISVYASHAQHEVDLEWNWINRDSADERDTVKNDPFYLPWYSGKRGDGRRAMYTPTESQISSGDWYRVGYPQEQFTQSVSKGKQRFYCMRSVFRRGGRTTWDREHQPSGFNGPSFSVYDTCPFRTTDNRDAYLRFSMSFWIPEQELANNPNALDVRLDAMDAWLKPMWDSLEVMPKAYQFDAP